MMTALLLACCLQGAPEAAPAKEEGLLQKGSFPGSYRVSGSDVSFKFGGYFKLDVIHDFDAIGSEDSFDPRTIPTDGSEGENTQVHARQTRFNVDVRTPTELGDVRLFAEVDFFSDQNGLRLRHAYATLGGLLVGQTWTTFMDEDVIPPTLDFEEPSAYVMVRVAQVRWTQPLAEDWYIAFGLEAPDSEIDTMPVPGDREDPYPDLTSRLRWTHGIGHVQLSGWGGYARFRPDTNGTNDALLWSVMITGAFDVFRKDRFLYQAAVGRGLARYRGGLVAAPDADGHLDALPVAAFMVSYEHYWTDALSSNLCYSVAHESNTDGQTDGDLKTVRYAGVNLVYRFLSWAWVGVEYLYGFRRNRDDADGEANRVMVSFRFNLP